MELLSRSEESSKSVTPALSEEAVTAEFRNRKAADRQRRIEKLTGSRTSNETGAWFRRAGSNCQSRTA